MTGRDCLVQAGFTPVTHLGRGGIGDVYEVERADLDRSAAVRVMPVQSRTHAPQKHTESLQRQLESLTLLEHSNIIRTHEFGFYSGFCWIRMDLAPGDGRGLINLQDLADYNKGVIEPEQLIELISGVLTAVSWAHNRGIVHGMLKPSNILLYRLPDKRLVARVGDFCLASLHGENALRRKIRSALQASVEKKVPPGKRGDAVRRLIATWQYWSPEQQAGQPADMRSDVFSLGMICYRMITGRKLSPRPPSSYNKYLSSEYDCFILKALDSDPAARYANAGQMLQALEPARNLVARQMLDKRTEEINRTIDDNREKARELVLRREDDQALELLRKMMERFPGRQDIVEDYSAIEDLRHHTADAERREEDYHWELQEALKLEKEGDLDGAYKAWRNLENLCPDRPEPPSRIDDLKRRIDERNQMRLQTDMMQAQQQELQTAQYEDVLEYRRLRSTVWDAAETGQFTQALKILKDLRERFRETPELLGEIEVIEKETHEARRVAGNTRLIRALLILAGVILIGVAAWFLWPFISVAN